MSDETNVRVTARSGRLYCNMFFLAAGIGIGSWAACLPVLSAQMQLDKGQLGLVLLFFALGAIAAMSNVGRFSAYLSCNALSVLGALVFSTALIVIPHLHGTVWLALVVCIGGAGFGTLDVSMNTEASIIERRAKRHLMSSFHALFSIGNLAGAFLVGKILAHGGALVVCLGVTGVGVGLLTILAFLGGRSVGEFNAANEPHAADKGILDNTQLRYLYFIGGVAFLAFLAEGALIDWSAIYLVTIADAATSTGAYGFAVFASTMAFGRLIGDALTARLGSTRLVLLGSMICAASLAIMLIFPLVPVVFVMLAACGLGVANIIPAMFAAAGRAGGNAAARAMSIVSTMGYAGLLLGPAILGLVAQMTTLVISLSLVVIAFIAISLATRSLRSA